MLLHPGISDKVEAIVKGDEGDRVCSGTDGVDLGEKINLLWGGALDVDALNLHAAVHVEGLATEEACNLDADEELAGAKGGDAESPSKEAEPRVSPVEMVVNLCVLA